MKITFLEKNEKEKKNYLITFYVHNQMLESKLFLLACHYIQMELFFFFVL